ncbi:hypothetical protein Dimus_011187 [Dionaea muscipula]
MHLKYIRKDMLVEVGNGDISPSFNQVLELLLDKSEYLALTPDIKETRRMVNLMSLQFPLLKELEEKRKEKSKFAYERKKQLAKLRVKAEKVVEEKLGSQLDILAAMKY